MWIRFLVAAAALGVSLPLSIWAQSTVPDPQMQAQQHQKSMQYLRIEYERCRNDLTEIWAKGDLVEQRAKALEAEVQKLTEELGTLRAKTSEKPAN